MGKPPETRQQSIKDQFLRWATDRSETATEEELRSYFDDSNASESFVDEPFVAQRRGRRPKAIGKREPSGWEKKTPKQSQKNSGPTDGGSDSQKRSFRYQDQFPPQTAHWIRGYNDVIGDGNCGYRVIAQYQYNQQERWADVRQDLIDELNNNRQLYINEMGEARFNEINIRLDWFHGGCDIPWHFQFPDMGSLVATKYQRVFISYSSSGCLTYLPLECRSQMDSQAPDPPSTAQEWTIGHINNNHYIRLHVVAECPLPPIWLAWEGASEARINHWQQHYAVRLRQWSRF